MEIAFKFVRWDVPALETLKDSEPYALKEKLLRGEKLSRGEKDTIFREISLNSYSRTGIPLQGWMFSFLPWLTPYYIEYKWGNIQKVYAPDKTAIRNEYGSHNINKITKAV